MATRRPMAPPTPTPPAPAAPTSPVGRRIFLGMAGLGALGIVVGARVQAGIGRALRPLVSDNGLNLGALIPGSDQFRIYSITGSLPYESPSAYRLTVDGLVSTPLTLSLDDLKAMPPARLVRDFQCVTGWRVPSVEWRGVLVSDLLDRAGVRPGASALSFSSFDGAYTESLTLGQARRRDVIVAYEMEGGPVSRDHGGPVRLYVAPMYGYKSCKWLSGIHVVNRVEPGYWEGLGYDVDAWVGHSNGRSDAATSTG